MDREGCGRMASRAGSSSTAPELQRPAGIRRIGRRPDQQQQQQQQGEGKPIDRRPERRPPRERRFEKPAEEKGEGGEFSVDKENEVEEVKEEGPKEMTLDEWKAIQSKDRAKVEFNIRKPNEGADGQWKKGFVLHKSKSEEESRNPLVLIGKKEMMCGSDLVYSLTTPWRMPQESGKRENEDLMLLSLGKELCSFSSSLSFWLRGEMLSPA
ncbi:hypothetical protein DV515_00017874 [Chloebia gouldiae]|uniref:Hyaluronan/mRNA-binding protein domain-containing protein n=1 Tax=Chloebia gouldiae TaxID=44316 RepID=A0A3L8Q962_CHLGU|nr:hypothetical protein DV515_00017874 [Chloebia gouldiae]